MNKRAVIEYLESIAVDIANALCGDVHVIGHDAITSVRTMQAKAGPFIVSCLMLGDQLVSYHVDVVVVPVAGTGPQPYASEVNTALVEFHAAKAALYAWRPVEEAPFLMWLATKRENEAGENICFARLVKSTEEIEWIDRHGRTTVTHHSFAAPTHWHYLKAGEPRDLPKPRPAPTDALFCRQHSSAFGRRG